MRWGGWFVGARGEGEVRRGSRWVVKMQGGRLTRITGGGSLRNWEINIITNT